MPSAPFTIGELLEERGRAPETRDRPMLRGPRGAVVTYAEFLARSSRVAHALRDRARSIDGAPRVAALLRNHPEFLDLYGGAALSGTVVCGINTGLGGDVLRRVLDASRATSLVVDRQGAEAVEPLLGQLTHLRREDVLEIGAGRSFQAAVDEAARRHGAAADDPPEVPGLDLSSPFAVIYTSGTTGLPKGIVNSHKKLRGIGMFVAGMVGLRPEDVGYLSMPLFHSNALFLGWFPALQAGASVAMREKFSASGFLDDVRERGITYWNFVGQPVHYVLEAIARAHGGDVERVRREVRDDPRNTLRLVIGTGATGTDRRRLIDWLGLEHAYENYGSTEAEISTWCMPGDPIDSVGEALDPDILVVDDRDEPCEPLELDERGIPTNADRAVGEIVRRGVSGRFEGYDGNPEATAGKVRDGLYRSGDLGALRQLGTSRYLYFFGRTDDWIRKDGENFSAESVVELVTAFPAVDRAAAYGVPHPVSDEWVMAAVRLREGQRFDPQAFFAHCEGEVQAGRDRKWFPDFVRVVEDFPWTETLKIKVRELKAAAYDPARVQRIFYRRRGGDRFEPFGPPEYAALAAELEQNGRAGLLPR
ncbi:MAG: AMP-binding protein [Polyangiaceae bacterium]|nr:AMP-binding protein [Polyangiaceae bacterium]